MLTAAFSSRSACLCTKHQNASLTIKALRKAGVDIDTNPEKVLDKMPAISVLKDSLDNSVTISQWKRVEVEEKRKKKYVTKIVENKMDKDQFLVHFEEQMGDFRSHVFRVREQFEQIRILKSELPKHEILVQLDFAENYSCKSLDEVQSAYFNQTCVTLHLLVVYYKASDDSLQHKSFITISDEMAHKSSNVITFLKDIMPSLKAIDDELKRIHYWSDSPTSQYRNKFMFDFVASHEELFGVAAYWNYFEAGHGKGPCDGLGGTCKRMADEAMRTCKAVIQDAHAFFNWATKSSMKNVTFRFVASEECEKAEKDKKELKPIKDTMKIHAVVGLGDSEIKVRNTSCYCKFCLIGDHCGSWRNVNTFSGEKVMRAVKEKASPSNTIEIEHAEGADAIISTVESRAQVGPGIGDYVAAAYDNKWYIGEICDKDDLEFEINFMEARKQFFKWPCQSDKLWLPKLSCANYTNQSQPERAEGCFAFMRKIGSLFSNDSRSYKHNC